MTGDSLETEVKLRVTDKSAIVARLRAAGFTIAGEREFEGNTIYDTPDRALCQKGVLLRLRQTRGMCILTWKGPAESGPHKRRVELETIAGSYEILHQIFTQLGFQPSFRYEKYRTEFSSAHDCGLVTLDETPIGNFLELEGPAEWIDRTAARLGFSPSDYILDSYARLYELDCARRGVEPQNMTFASLGEEQLACPSE
jgi:adenylate cyclase class 2